MMCLLYQRMENLGNKVKLTNVDNGYTKAEIIGKIKNIGS